jgi:hypothetical protein
MDKKLRGLYIFPFVEIPEASELEMTEIIRSLRQLAL